MKQNALVVETRSDLKRLNEMFDEGWLVKFVCSMTNEAALVILGDDGTPDNE